MKTRSVEMRSRLLDSNSDDLTAGTKKPQPSRFSCSKYDTIIIIINIVLLTLGVGFGLLAFFLIGYRDKENLKTNFMDKSLYYVGLVNTAVRTYERVVETSQYHVATSWSKNVSLPNYYYNSFLPFIEGSNNMIDGMEAIVFLSEVYPQDVKRFVTSVRDSGVHPYNTFDVWERNLTTFQRENITARDVYYFITMGVPRNYMWGIGYDSASVPMNRRAIDRALDTKKIAATRRTKIITTAPNVYSFIIYAPVYRDGEFIGFTDGTVASNRLIETALGGPFLDSTAIVSLYDVPLEYVYEDDPVYCSIRGPHQARTVTLSTNNMTLLQQSDYQAIANNAPFKATYNVRVADRMYSIVMIPTTDFMNETGPDKWIALLSIITCSVGFSFIVFIFAKRIQYYGYVQNLSRERVQILEDSQQRLQQLLDKIAVQEKRTRDVMDSIPDFLITINAVGIIQQTNACFDRSFAFTAKDYENGVNVSKIFPDLKPNFYDVADELQTVDTRAKCRLTTIPVQISVRMFLDRPRYWEQEENTQTNKEAYLIVARNMSDRDVMRKRSAHTNRSVIDQRFIDFDNQLRQTEFRTAFKKFCEKEFNSENIEFLEAVAAYRRAPLEKRVQMQGEIFDRFIRIDAERQLNTDSDLKLEYSLRVSKSLGDVTLFDDLEDKVKDMMLHDSYARFMQQLSNQQ
jgi:hypothetical protein